MSNKAKKQIGIWHEIKVVIVKEEPDGIGNLMSLTRLTFIDEEYGNFQVVDVWALTKNNYRQKKFEVLQEYRCQICGKCYRRNWGKHNFSCGYYFHR